MNLRISWKKTQKQMFLLVSSGHILCPSKGHQHGVIQIVNLVKTFFRISHICIIAQTSFLARLFVYLSSFISQILNILYWLFCIFIFDGVTVKIQNIPDIQNWNGAALNVTQRKKKILKKGNGEEFTDLYLCHRIQTPPPHQSHLPGR